jgi:hypothetical protein
MNTAGKDPGKTGEKPSDEQPGQRGVQAPGGTGSEVRNHPRSDVRADKTTRQPPAGYRWKP